MFHNTLMLIQTNNKYDSYVDNTHKNLFWSPLGKIYIYIFSCAEQFYRVAFSQTQCSRGCNPVT